MRRNHLPTFALLLLTATACTPAAAGGGKPEPGPPPCGPETQAGDVCTWPAESYRLALTGHGVGSRPAEPGAPATVIPGMRAVVLLSGEPMKGWTQRTFAAQVVTTFSDCDAVDEPGVTGWEWSGGTFGFHFCGSGATLTAE